MYNFNTLDTDKKMSRYYSIMHVITHKAVLRFQIQHVIVFSWAQCSLHIFRMLLLDNIYEHKFYF